MGLYTVDRELVKFAHSCADASQKIAQSYFRSDTPIDFKSDSSPVTKADQEIEQKIRGLIETQFPEHGVYGEEQGTVRLDADYLWVIDPIDGTRAFISGMPTFGLLMALLYKGKPVLGIIDNPILNERWSAQIGKGARLNRKPTCVRTNRSTLKEAILFSTSPDMFNTAEKEVHDILSAQVLERRFGGDCYAAGLLTSGYIDLYVESDLQPYDYMALVPIIEEAGGVITDWKGAPLTLHSSGQLLAAATPNLHQQALEILHPAAHQDF